MKSLMEKEVIEISPLAYMRGRTLNNSFIILDEAQNATQTQMKMFLTRMGEHSKAIVTGDITQIDLSKKQSSGLLSAKHILRAVDGIGFVYFDNRDVVRHRLVAKIIEAYERQDEKKSENNDEEKKNN
jgi:phosphate starvation-inducible PhoH-like protein